MYHCDDFIKFYIKLENLRVLKKTYIYQKELKSIEIFWKGSRKNLGFSLIYFLLISSFIHIHKHT